MSNCAATNTKSLAYRAQQALLLAALACIGNGVWMAYHMELASVAMLLAAMAVLPALHLFGFVETVLISKAREAVVPIPNDVRLTGSAYLSTAAESAVDELWYDLPPKYKDVSLLSRERLGAHCAYQPGRASPAMTAQTQGETQKRACHVH